MSYKLALKKYRFIILLVVLVVLLLVAFIESERKYEFQTESEPIIVVPLPTEQPRKDERELVLENFLHKKKSPLATVSGEIIQAADESGLDWKLIPSIAGVESGFETAGNLRDHNPFGYMCSGKPCYFDSYEDSIRAVAKTISTKGAYAQYRKSGSLSDLAIVYNQVSPQEWVSKIIYFQEAITNGSM
jgi:hypothetical protein